MHPRQSRPVIQKFARPDMIEGFLRDPQRSLVYTEDDLLHRSVAAAGRADATMLQKLAGRILERTNTRKLFLPAHNRFYLVVCELHCDAPGLPDLPASGAAEYGFVLRRLRGGAEGSDVVEASEWAPLGELAKKVAQLRAVSASSPPGVRFFRARKKGLAGSEVHEAFEATRRATLEELTAEILPLREQVSEALSSGAWQGLRRLEGWVPSEHEGIGSWLPVDAEPDEVRERVFPLLPLAPDPRVDDHSAEGATLLFGMVPTSSLESDAWGGTHIDPSHDYRIRCFVREPGEKEGCPGPVRWSRPSEAFRVASQADPVGTSQRPLTIHLPDVADLAAQVGSGRAPGGVRMVTPDASEPTVVLDEDGNPTGGPLGGGQICSFSIPLITIIARFVLSIFLPIVIIAFQLWWMLLLKLCIPPSIDFGAKLDAAASLEGSFDVDGSATVEVALESGVANLTHAELRSELMSDFLGTAGGSVHGKDVDDLGEDFVPTLAATRRAHLEEFEMGLAAAAAGLPPEVVGAPSLMTGLEWEPRIHDRPTVREVVARQEVA